MQRPQNYVPKVAGVITTQAQIEARKNEYLTKHRRFIKTHFQLETVPNPSKIVEVSKDLEVRMRGVFSKELQETKKIKGYLKSEFEPAVVENYGIQKGRDMLWYDLKINYKGYEVYVECRFKKQTDEMYNRKVRQIEELKGDNAIYFSIPRQDYSYEQLKQFSNYIKQIVESKKHI